MSYCFGKNLIDTVDGRNPANQLIWRIYHCLQGFIYLRWCRISSINSITAKRFGDQNPGICYRDYATQLYREYNIKALQGSGNLNQSGFHGMSCQGLNVAVAHLPWGM